MKEAQKMQAKMQAMQENLATQTFDASVAGGAVKATVNGQGKLVGLNLDPEFLKEDLATVQSSIVEAVAQAQDTAAKTSEMQMNALGSAFKGLMG